MFSIMDSAAELPDNRFKTSADRACDQCKARKVRCDMKRPCIVCESKGFECTYDKARKKRGPTGKRIQEIRLAQARANSEAGSPNGTGYHPSDQLQAPLRSSNSVLEPELEDFSTSGPYWPQQGAQDPLTQHFDDQSLQRIETSTTTFSEPQSSIPPLDPMLTSPGEFVFPSLPIDSPSSSWDPFNTILQHVSPQATGTRDIWPSHINEETLLPWIDVYFKRLHPTIPMLDRAEMYRDMLGRKHRTDSQYGAMLLGLCAFAMTQPIQIHERDSAPSRSVQARMLMEECVKMRVAPDFGEYPSIDMILASFFLFACLFGNGQHKAARHKMREAVDLAYSLGIHSPQTYESLDSESRQRYLRTFLVLSVTERAYALQQRHPIGFRGRPGVSARFMQDFSPNDASDYIKRLIYADQADATAMTGLIYLMDTFDAIDERVIECWIGYCRYSDGACETFDRRRALSTFAALRNARESARDGNISFAPSVSPLPLAKLLDTHQADISVAQLWLLNRVWNLCLSHGLIRESSDHQELTYLFACEVATATAEVCSTLPLDAMEVHGVGFAEKVHDIATGVLTAIQSSGGSIGLSTQLSQTTDNVSFTPSSQGTISVQDLLQKLRMFLGTFRGGDQPYSVRFAEAHDTLLGYGR